MKAQTKDSLLVVGKAHLLVDSMELSLVPLRVLMMVALKVYLSDPWRVDEKGHLLADEKVCWRVDKRVDRKVDQLVDELVVLMAELTVGQMADEMAGAMVDVMVDSRDQKQKV